LHLHFLGLDITLPEPVSGENNRDPSGQDSLCVLASEEGPISCQTTVSTVMQQIIRSSLLSSTVAAAPTDVVESAAAPAFCTSLCDRARQERSGVLLA
jgi:hypothetical protein